MVGSPISDTQEFSQLFDFGDKYYCFRPLKDRKVAFSVQADYPDNIPFRPAKNQKGEYDDAILIHVVYGHPEEIGKEKFNPEKVPVFVRISHFSRFLRNHLDYSDDDINSPTFEEVKASRKTRKPLDIDLFEEFFYSHSEQSFLHGSEKVSGEYILDKAVKKHCDTVNIFSSVGMKVELFSMRKIYYSYKERLLKWSIEKMGRTIEPEDSFSGLLKPFGQGDLKVRESELDNFDFFGFKVSKNSFVIFIFLYVFFVFLSYIGFIGCGYISYAFSNLFSSIMHSIFVMVLLQKVPDFMFWRLNKTIEKRVSLSLSSI
jgi:hypothetical protein